jgi:hypothetical protein
MANENHNIGAPAGRYSISVRNKISGGSIATGDGLDATTFAATKDLNALKAALNTANSTYYTQARMQTMSWNDLLHCWLIQQGIKAA